VEGCGGSLGAEWGRGRKRGKGLTERGFVVEGKARKRRHRSGGKGGSRGQAAASLGPQGKPGIRGETGLAVRPGPRGDAGPRGEAGARQLPSIDVIPWLQLIFDAGKSTACARIAAQELGTEAAS